MRATTLTIVFAAACQSPAPTTDTAVSASTFVDPHTIVVPAGTHLDPDSFFQVYAEKLGLGGDDTMELVTERPSQIAGRTMRLYRQVHAGVPIGAGLYHLSLRDGVVRTGNGTIIS